MATFKAYIEPKALRKDGTWNIKIRVNHGNRRRVIPTMWYVPKEDVTRSFKVKNRKYIEMTEDLIREYRHKCDALGNDLRHMTVGQVCEIAVKSVK